METQFPMTYRRLRRNTALRRLVADTHIRPEQLIQPYFIYEGIKEAAPLENFFGQYKHTPDSLCRTIEQGLEKQCTSALLFFVPQNKAASHFNYDFDTKVLEQVKRQFGDNLNLFVDVCLCSNTDTGHCGFLGGNGAIDNHSSVQELANKALAYAQAGADAVCPSDMMDDRIAAIRQSLDEHGQSEKMILSYCTKFSSSFYGPFRDAAKSAPSLGNRKSYQIDPANSKDALRCALRDAEQGADILMVKPGLAYLDIIHRIKTHPDLSTLPLCAYQVSGEYQSLYVAAENGLFNFEDALLETLIALRRAGADMIISYAANRFQELAERLS